MTCEELPLLEIPHPQKFELRKSCRFSIVQYGILESCNCLYGNVWSCMVLHGLVCSCMFLCGFIWSLKIYIVCSFMIIYGLYALVPSFFGHLSTEMVLYGLE